MQSNGTCFVKMELNKYKEFNITIIIIIIVFLLSSNLLMINGITKVNFNLKMSHKLYILQGILGLVNGGIILPLYILTQSLPNESRCVIAFSTLFGVVYLNLLEMITLALLSTIRYYAVKYQRNFSGRKVNLRCHININRCIDRIRYPNIESSNFKRKSSCVCINFVFHIIYHISNCSYICQCTAIKIC